MVNKGYYVEIYSVIDMCERGIIQWVQLRVVGKVGVKWFRGVFYPKRGLGRSRALVGKKGGCLDSDSLLTIQQSCVDTFDILLKTSITALRLLVYLTVFKYSEEIKKKTIETTIRFPEWKNREQRISKQTSYTERNQKTLVGEQESQCTVVGGKNNGEGCQGIRRS